MVGNSGDVGCVDGYKDCEHQMWKSWSASFHILFPLLSSPPECPIPNEEQEKLLYCFNYLLSQMQYQQDSSQEQEAKLKMDIDYLIQDNVRFCKDLN